MIRHDISPAELKTRIVKLDPDWFAKAAKVVAKLPAKPSSKQFISLWSDIKRVWIDLQGSKCMYCETLIEGDISNDIEHFRPKAKVSGWKLPKKYASEGVKVTPPKGPKGDSGYRDLAYNPWNYAASCKVCNSILKKNYFPIAGTRKTAAKNPRAMKSERALFVYPIGDFDDDPQDLIRFAGMHPEPAAQKGTVRYCRALVMIEAFQLNDADERKPLFQARALLMKPLFDAMEKFHSSASASDRQDAKDWIDIYVDSRAPHSSCLRNFKTIYNKDAARAAKLVQNAKYFLQTGSLATS